MTDKPSIIVERQPDNFYAVYIEGDSDIAGDWDRAFGWGPIVDGHRITEIDARRAAIGYAKRLARQLGGTYQEPV